MPEQTQVSELLAKTTILHAADVQRALEAARNAMDLASNQGDAHSAALAKLEFGKAARAGGRPEEALTAFKEAQVVFRLLGDQSNTAQTILAEGEVLKDMGRVDEALVSLKVAAEYAAESSDAKLPADVARALGVVYHNMRMYEDAIRCFRQARTLYQQAGDRVGEATSLNSLAAASVADVVTEDGSLLDERGVERFRNASMVWKEALEIAEPHGLTDLSAKIQYNLAVGYDLSGQHELAVSQATRLVEASKQSKMVRTQARALVLLGQALVHMKQWTEAIPHLESAVTLARENSLQFVLEDALESLAIAQESADDIVGAMLTLQARIEAMQSRTEDAALAQVRAHAASLEEQIRRTQQKA